MEKKLTDEEIVKSLVHCSSNCSCEYCYHNDEVGSGEIVCRARLMIKAIDLIHRLQDEVERLKPKKRILANRVYSNETLKRWKKEDLIEHIRILEHNWSCAEESYNNAVKNSDKIFAEQKAEIERLTEENRVVKHNMDFHRNKKFELQKQVDELTEERENMEREILGLEEEKRQLKGFIDFKTANVMCEKCKEQAVKDTSKEMSDDELKVVALKFIHDLTEEIEKREKNERGEMQEENKPFEEFNGKE